MKRALKTAPTTRNVFAISIGDDTPICIAVYGKGRSRQKQLSNKMAAEQEESETGLGDSLLDGDGEGETESVWGYMSSSL